MPNMLALTSLLVAIMPQVAYSKEESNSALHG